MLNTNVTNVLQEVQKITNSIILKYPQTIANSSAGDVLVSMNISELDSESFEDIGIYNLSEFLSTFKLFSSDRKIQRNENVISIQEKNLKAEYITNSISLLSDYDKPVSIFTTTMEMPSVSEFELTVEDINKINQASKVFSDLEEVQFTSKDGDMMVSLTSTNKFNAKSNKFEMMKSSTSSKEFNITIPTENFNNLPNGVYKVHVKYKETKNMYRLVFESQEIKSFDILMSAKTIS